MEISDLQLEIMRQHGINLPLDDPSFAVVTINKIMLTGIVDRLETVAARIETTDRPLLTPQQIKTNLLPVLLAAFQAAQILIGVGVVLLSAAIGAGVMWWQTPALTCDGTRMTMSDQSTRPICYRFNGPPVPAAPIAAPPSTAPEAPPGAKKLGAR